MYHAFSVGRATHDPYDLIVDVAEFEDQLLRLRAMGWQALDLNGYLAWRPGDRPGYLVTIDDGFESALELAGPVMSRLEVPAVMYVPAGLLGGTSSWLPEQPDLPLISPDRVRELAGMRIEVGGHGWDHPDMRRLAADELQQNTAVVRERLHELAGYAPRSFAYPFGWHDRAARAAVQAAGYDIAFSIYEDRGPWAVSRSDVKPADTWSTVRWKLRPGYRRLWRAAGVAKPFRAALRRATQRR